MKKSFKNALGITVTLGLIATAGLAASHASVSNKTVAARHAQMTMVSYHIGVLGGIAKGEMEYSAEMVDAAATNLRELAKMQKASLWIPGTEQGAVDGSRAKAEIWSDPEGFAAAFTDMENAASALIGAADAAAVGAGMGPLGGSCKGCHEKYRGPKG